MKKREGGVLAWTAAVFLLVGMAADCSRSGEARCQLNPKQPVMITVWNYYSGQTKRAFDSLVSKLDETLDTEMGIIADSASYGDISQLAEEAYNSASGRLGTGTMSNPSAAYPENVYRIDVLGKFVDLSQYFSEDELKVYRTDFLQDCSSGGNYGLKILPVVCFTENLFLNKTGRDRFIGDTGVRLDRLSIWRGVIGTTKAYYEWSGGKAFLGIDSLVNYIIVASVQIGNDIYELQDSQVMFSFDQSPARILWDKPYVPYVKGYHTNLGKFRSDDEKTGGILAYVGPSAGAVYSPKEVILNQSEIYRIESSVLPYPRFRDGDLCATAQGVGFAITQSSSTHEHASVVFLKWLTQEEQNLDSAANGGYLSVENSSLNQGYAKVMVAHLGTPEYSPMTGGSAEATLKILFEHRFHPNPPLEGSYEMRQSYGEYMEASVDNARLEAEDKMKADMTKEEAQAQVTNEAHLQEWYEGWQDNAAKLLGS